MGWSVWEHRESIGQGALLLARPRLWWSREAVCKKKKISWLIPLPLYLSHAVLRRHAAGRAK